MLLLLSSASFFAVADDAASDPTTAALATAGKLPSLYCDTASIIDLHGSARLSLVTPAADNCPWVVLFYDSMCGHCRTFSAPFTELAVQLVHSGFLVGAVNCVTEEKICVSSNVSSVPLVYVGSPKKVRPPDSGGNGDRDGALPDLVRDARRHVKVDKNEHQQQQQQQNSGGGNEDGDEHSKSENGGFLVVNNNHGWYEASALSAADQAKLKQQQQKIDDGGTGGADDSQTDSFIVNNIREATNFIATRHGLPTAMCKDVARTLMLRKMQVIHHDHKKKLGKKKREKNNNKIAGAVTAKVDDADADDDDKFVPPRIEPCIHDLAGALFVAMRHEVVIAPRTLPNWWVLMQFLRVVHRALPNLGADNILAELKADRSAPSQSTWGALLEKALRLKLERDVAAAAAENQAEAAANNAGIGGNGQSGQNSKLRESNKGTAASKAGSSPGSDISIASVEWKSCRGSNPNLRGYTCGLWMLFHAVLSNSPPGTALSALQTIRDYIVNYFVCLECRVHFSEMRLPPPPPVTGNSDADKQESDKTAIIWLYRAHNGVNRRLERSGSTDPFVPKVQFPPRDLDFCVLRHSKKCPVSTSSSDEEILSFLREFYSWKNIVACNRDAGAAPRRQIAMSDAAESSNNSSLSKMTSGSFSLLQRLAGFSLGVAGVFLWLYRKRLSSRKDRSA